MTTPEEDAEIRRLLTVSTELATQKHVIQSKLATINNLIRMSDGRMPRDKYRASLEAQLKYKQQLAAIEGQLMKARDERRTLSAQWGRPKEPKAPELQQANGEAKQLVVDLCELRQHYQEFSADSTRVSSMRQMASDFVLKLNGIIRAATAPARATGEGAV